KLIARTNSHGEASNSIKTIILIAAKQISIMLQYKFDILYWIFMPLLWVIPYIWLGNSLVSGGTSSAFEKYTGSSDYVGFLLIGSMLWSTIDSALWGAGNALRWEQNSGTLEYLWVSPVSRTDILAGTSLGESLWVTCNIIGQFIIVSIIFGWNITALNTILSFIAVIIMFIGMLGFGFLFASIIMIFKEPGVLTELVDSFMFIVSPVRYPIEGLPTILRYIAVVLPFTWGAKIIRDLFLVNSSLINIFRWFGILIIIDICMWMIGYRIFTAVEKRTRQTGKLGEY
ncbi:MAG: ABC transporter permease, partial [Candidatus Heimdallarchaeota archaeon]|nr:ABC transporter permease [Candidatus Heimdallarchaeota archaeon]